MLSSQTLRFFIHVQKIFVSSTSNSDFKKRKWNARRSPAVLLNKLISKILILEQVQ